MFELVFLCAAAARKDSAALGCNGRIEAASHGVAWCWGSSGREGQCELELALGKLKLLMNALLQHGNSALQLARKHKHTVIIKLLQAVGAS